MVDHLLHITVEAAGARAVALAGALVALGFQAVGSRGRVVASSAVIGTQEAKDHLRSLGFADREYRIHLEYVRRWGFL